MVKKKKRLKIFFSRMEKASWLNLGIRHLAFRVYQVCSNDDPRLTFDCLKRQGQIYIPMHLYGENIENSVSQNELKTNG